MTVDHQPSNVRTFEGVDLLRKKLEMLLRLDMYTRDQIQAIARITCLATYEPGAVIQKDQRFADGFHLVLFGAVQIDEREYINHVEYQTSRTLKTGDCFGETSLFDASKDESKRVVTAAGAAQCTVLKIPVADFAPIQSAAKVGRC